MLVAANGKSQLGERCNKCLSRKCSSSFQSSHLSGVLSRLRSRLGCLDGSHSLVASLFGCLLSWARRLRCGSCCWFLRCRWVSHWGRIHRRRIHLRLVHLRRVHLRRVHWRRRRRPIHGRRWRSIHGRRVHGRRRIHRRWVHGRCLGSRCLCWRWRRGPGRWSDQVQDGGNETSDSSGCHGNPSLLTVGHHQYARLRLVYCVHPATTWARLIEEFVDFRAIEHATMARIRTVSRLVIIITPALSRHQQRHTLTKQSDRQ